MTPEYLDMVNRINNMEDRMLYLGSKCDTTETVTREFLKNQYDRVDALKSIHEKLNNQHNVTQKMIDIVKEDFTYIKVMLYAVLALCLFIAW